MATTQRPPAAAPAPCALPSAARLTGLAPLVADGARLLVLGSFPSVVSLQVQQYYAHPRNHFWPIVSAIWGLAGADALQNRPYAERVAAAQQRGLAIWDVYAGCQREGSLDAAIRGEVPNDFATFFAAHPNIRHIGLNGGKAAASFRKHAAQHQPASAEAVVLPSTSPAYASLNLEAKCALWRAALMA